MADDYDYDGEGFMDAYDDDWLYVEDEFALADELAETQIADPGYAGTNNELQYESFDYDLYGYWDELEYANDEYWEYDGQRPRHQSDVKAGSKRKRGAPSRVTHTTDKKRKVSEVSSTPAGNPTALPHPVLFQSRQMRVEASRRRPPVLKDGVVFALLPDWKERFADNEGALGDGQMPVDMLRAAEADMDDTPERVKSHQIESDDADEEGWEDEDEGEDDRSLAMDPDMLKDILRQKLGEVGLEGMDESAFMTTISRMLAGEDGADEAAGELANSLLGKATDGDASLSGWLSRQGVSLDEAEDDDVSSMAIVELPEGPRGLNLQVSPSDSVIGTSAPSQRSSTTRELVLHPSSPERQMQQPAEQSAKKKKKTTKKVTFDVPPSSEPSSQPNGAGTVDDEINGTVLPPSSSDPLTSGPILRSRASKSKAMNGVDAVANAAEVDEPTRQMRKRKAANGDSGMAAVKRTRNARSTT